MALTSIPPEIWRETFLYLEPYDMFILRTTSRFFACRINPQSTLREIGHPRKRNYYLNCNGWNQISMILSAIFDGNRDSAKLIIDFVFHSKSLIFIQRMLLMGGGVLLKAIKCYNNPDCINDIGNLHLYYMLERGNSGLLSIIPCISKSRIDIHMYLLRSSKIALLRSALLQMPVSNGFSNMSTDNICDLFITRYGQSDHWELNTDWLIEDICPFPGCGILIQHLMKTYKVSLPYYDNACPEYLLICNERDTSSRSSETIDRLNKTDFISIKDYNDIVKRHKLE